MLQLLSAMSRCTSTTQKRHGSPHHVTNSYLVTQQESSSKTVHVTAGCLWAWAIEHAPLHSLCWLMREARRWFLGSADSDDELSQSWQQQGSEVHSMLPDLLHSLKGPRLRDAQAGSNSWQSCQCCCIFPCSLYADSWRPILACVGV